MKKIAVITGASSGIGKHFAETVKQAGTFTEFKYYAHYHNSTLLLADTKVRSGDGNAYFTPEADFDKMMKDIMTYLLGKSVLVDGAGTPVTAQSADVQIHTHKANQGKRQAC